MFARRAPGGIPDSKPGQSPLSRLGWALLAQAAVPLAVQYAAVLLAELLAPGWAWPMWAVWLLSTGSVYGVGFPAFCLVIRGAPAARPEGGRPLGAARFLQVYVGTLGLTYLVNYATVFLMRVLGALLGGTVTNPVNSMSEYPVALNLLLGCVIAPLAEELMFRRLLLDRLLPYGEKFTVAASALCFGLFHGNLSQFFYAFAIGLVFGSVAVRTGRLWQTVLLHAMVNFISAGLVPLLTSLGEVGTLLMAVLVYGSILLACALLPRLRREIRFRPDTSGLAAGSKWRLLLVNPSMVCFCLIFAVQAISYLL